MGSGNFARFFGAFLPSSLGVLIPFQQQSKWGREVSADNMSQLPVVVHFIAKPGSKGNHTQLNYQQYIIRRTELLVSALLVRERPGDGRTRSYFCFPRIHIPGPDILLERVGTGLLGTIGYVVLPTGVSTDVSRDIVWRPDKGMTTTTFQVVTETIWSWELSPNPGCSHTN